jgi:hypothetical protein
MMQYSHLCLAFACSLFASSTRADQQNAATAPAFSKFLLDVPVETRATLQKIRIGQRGAEVLALLQSHSFDHARLTYGGTGNGRLYIRLSQTSQLCLEVEGPTGIVRTIGQPEQFTGWKRRPDGSIDFPVQSVRTAGK